MYTIMLNITSLYHQVFLHYDAVLSTLTLLQKIDANNFVDKIPWIIGIVSAFTFIMAFILDGISVKLLAKKVDNITLDEAIEAAGYDYDPHEDAFFSLMDPWQRKYGYCRLYDEAAAPLSMIIDCEPIYFEYDGKKWMIEFWKGQYGMTTGCEIGIYTDPVDLKIPGIFLGTFYNSASDDDLLYMSCVLKKNGKKLFKRQGMHWWLTGFKLGEFSQPSELTMELKIVFKSAQMCDAFITGLLEAGYIEDRITRFRNSVRLTFDKPLTEQPYTRTEVTDWIIQKKNKITCDMYQEATKAYPDITQKLLAFRAMQPALYRKAVHIGKARQVYDWFDTIKDYLS